MIRFNTLCYLLKEGVIGIWRNKMMTLATLGTIVLSLLIIGMSYILVENTEYIMRQAETKFGITAYIDDSLTNEEIEAAYKTITNLEDVIEVSFISKDDALQVFASDSEDESLFEAFKEDNPLPASFEIQVNAIDNQNHVLTELYKIKGLAIEYLAAETDMFSNIRKVIQTVSVVSILMLVLTGVMLMSNTIKLTLHIRRKQINIMKYIGATNTFIRLPFLVEGLLTGLVGAIIPIGITALVYKEVQVLIAKYLGSMLKGIELYNVEAILRGYIPLCLLVGLGIGVLGSGLALKKHLDV